MSPTEKLQEKAIQLGEKVRQKSAVILYDPNFSLWTGSLKNKHHYGKGGLAQHTWEVVEIAFTINKLLNCNVDEIKLFYSCLFHDVGKLWDYSPVDENYTLWIETPHARKIHHISRSALVWSNSFDREWQVEIEYEKKYHDDVLHAILSHHGCREYGSPVSPFTKLAWLLHLSDSMSARLNDCEKVDLFLQK